MLLLGLVIGLVAGAVLTYAAIEYVGLVFPPEHEE